MDKKEENVDAKKSVEEPEKSGKKLKIAVICALVLLCITLPYWAGRELAFANGRAILSYMNFPSFFFLAIGWLSIVLTGFFLLLTYYFKRSYGFAALLCFGLVQFFAGFCFLKNNFVNPNYIVFLNSAYKANSIDTGIIIAAIGLLMFAVYFITATITTKPNTKAANIVGSAVAITIYFAFEIFALIIACYFGFAG